MLHIIQPSHLQFPGPNEAGLAFMRDRTAKSPRTQMTWRGLWSIMVLLRHPETVRPIVNSSGTIFSFLAQYLSTIVISHRLTTWLIDGGDHDSVHSVQIIKNQNLSFSCYTAARFRFDTLVEYRSRVLRKDLREMWVRLVVT